MTGVQTCALPILLMDMEDFDRLIDIRAISYEKDGDEALITTDIVKATLAVNIYLMK